MLTVDYDRLGLRAGELLLDLGCGFGRHAFEAFRRGARVVACDMAIPELAPGASAVRGHGPGRRGLARRHGGGRATATPPGCRSPTARSTASSPARCMEHIPDDRAALDELARVLRPGGTLAVTIPAWLPEKICWALSDEYHAPFVAGGHVRIYTEGELRSKMRGAGLEPGARPPGPRPALARTGG